MEQNSQAMAPLYEWRCSTKKLTRNETLPNEWKNADSNKGFAASPRQVGLKLWKNASECALPAAATATHRIVI